MRAVVYSRYGPPEVLSLAEVERPEPADDEILVKIMATSINRSDWEGLVGKPMYARMGGLRRPRARVLGSDIAGRVEAAGPAHQGFATGEPVFGDIMARMGGFAEYVCLKGTTLARIPEGMTFEEAACLPQAGTIALRGIVDVGRVAAGQRVLINGAGGGAGSVAIQLAKRRGATVTGVDNAGKLEHMRAMGADHVVDHAREDFTKRGERYDLILDLIGSRSVFAYRRALAPGGTYLWVGGTLRALLRIVLLGRFVGRRSGRRIRVLMVQASSEALDALIAMWAAGEIVIPIERTVALEEVPEALRLIGEGRARGKIVVRVAADGASP